MVIYHYIISIFTTYLFKILDEKYIRQSKLISLVLKEYPHTNIQ